MLKVKLEPGLRLGSETLYPVPFELIALLNAIDRHGSLLKAIAEAGVSYRRAWSLLGRWEAICGHKLAVLTRGHGTVLTLLGSRLARVDEWLAERLAERLPGLERDLNRHLDVPPEPGDAHMRVHASNDIALLKLKERLQGRLVLDLRFEGSLNSLDSLARGDCDIAGFHIPEPPELLGPLVAEFRDRLHGREHYIALLFARHQGLMVTKERRRSLRSLSDLAGGGVRFVNRERGSGTRLLFDALLQRDGVAAAAIAGYEHEEFTHMATAATVRAGMADAAFGIEAAARAHGLHFLQVVTEHYYLACRRKSPARVALDAIVAGARSPAFQRVVRQIGGYEMGASGRSVRLRDLFAAARNGARARSELRDRA
ncbi:MAG TPA: substrate-binding domain-containing protein [Casimicrobiaceae bacterium]